MSLLTIACLVGLGLLAVWMWQSPPPNAPTMIQICNGVVRIKGGQLRPLAVLHVVDLIREAGITSGYIAITARRRVKFDRRIPPEIRQSIRNVLLNQGA